MQRRREGTETLSHQSLLLHAHCAPSCITTRTAVARVKTPFDRRWKPMDQPPPRGSIGASFRALLIRISTRLQRDAGLAIDPSNVFIQCAALGLSRFNRSNCARSSAGRARFLIRRSKVRVLPGAQLQNALLERGRIKKRIASPPALLSWQASQRKWRCSRASKQDSG